MSKWKDFLRIMKDVTYREPKFIKRHYRLALTSAGFRGFVFMADGKIPHGGLFDRLKGAMTIFALSKVYGREFRINFTDPFLLSDYIEPASYNWIPAEGEMSHDFPFASPIIAYGEIKQPRRLFKSRKNRQTHFYFGYDLVPLVNNRFNTHFDWGEMYRELFKPTARLQKYISACRAQIGGGIMWCI